MPFETQQAKTMTLIDDSNDDNSDENKGVRDEDNTNTKQLVDSCTFYIILIYEIELRNITYK